MENQLSFVFMLPLKEISLRRVVINLWNEKDILSSIEKFCSDTQGVNYDYSEKWRQAVECKVIEKLSKLVIPKSFKKQALLIVTPIGLEIKRWKVFHEGYLMSDWEEFHKNASLNPRIKFDAPILSKLCWTSSGTVDYRKTAEKLVRCEMLGILTCYQLACLYCLEDCIPLLWEELPEQIKKTFYNAGDTSQIKLVNLQCCWPYILKREEFKMDGMFKRVYGIHSSFNQMAFEFSAHRGNKAATEYFFQKLTHKEKKASLNTTTSFLAIVRCCAKLSYSVDSFPLENISDTLFHLMSFMNQEERMDILRQRSAEFLILFLDWHWHDLFLKVADLTWTFIPAQSYVSLLKNLSDYFKKQKYYFPFLNMFREFFICSPISFRKEFVDSECHSGDFLPRLFDIDDSETVKVIFRNVDAADRVRLVSCKHIFRLFCKFILKGKCDKVTLCLREAALSNEDREIVTDAFSAFMTDGRRNIKTSKSIRNRFLNLMDEIYGNAQSKRSSEDDAPKKFKKKLCFKKRRNC